MESFQVLESVGHGKKSTINKSEWDNLWDTTLGNAYGFVIDDDKWKALGGDPVTFKVIDKENSGVIS